MAQDTPSEGECNRLTLTLPATAGSFDEDYGDLSVIEVTPRHNSSDQFRAITSDVTEKPTSRTSDTFSAASSSDRPKRARKEGGGQSPVGTFVSSLARRWSKGGSGKGESRSPSSVVKVEEDRLNGAIFCSIDGVDAREFQEFLDEDGGDAQRIPVLCLVDYGLRGSYASDIFVMMHNTIRRELFDAFEIVKVLRQEYLSLTLNDIYSLRQWWRFFVILWRTFVTYEQTILHPLIQQITLVDGRADALRRKLHPQRQQRDWLELKMEEMTSYIEEFESLRPGRALCLFCKTVDAFAERATSYFASRERVLPSFIESYHGESIKTEAERALMTQLRQSPQFPELVIAVLRWMGSVQGFASPRAQQRERERWLGTHLGWMERYNLDRYYQRYEATHGRILTHFRRKLQNADSL